MKRITTVALAVGLAATAAPAPRAFAQGSSQEGKAPSETAKASAAAAGAAVTRISYWTTRPGRQAEARTFWKQFVPVFDEMKRKGLLVEYQFLTPELHTGQDWDLAYLWVCKDMVAYGQAVEFFGAAVAKMDGKKIETDFDAAFDGSKHRDEVWRSVAIE